MKKAFFFSALFLSFFLSRAEVFAQQRSYYYDSISYTIRINSDSTFDVEERQNFNYSGEYHQGWRNILLKDISDITDISVVDGKTNQALIYSGRRLTKEDPASWGKYTVFEQNGEKIIEWYYNLKDTAYPWILRYKVHGGITFLNDKDELYWNLLTDYSVPVRLADAVVFLPENNFTKDSISVSFYLSDDTFLNIPPEIAFTGKSYSVLDNRRAVFRVGDIPPQNQVTIAVGWPKGAVSQTAFFKDWFFLNLGYVFGALIILFSVAGAVIYWYVTEKMPKGRGTIIPQYEPPKNLRPAMAELVCKERISNKTWAATIVDLAVRGYVKIKEDEVSAFSKIGVIFGIIFIIFIGWSFLGLTADFSFYTKSAGSFIFFLIVVFLVGSILHKKFSGAGYSFRGLIPKEYTIEKTKDYETDPRLEGYEREFLLILFKIMGSGNYFSTKEMKKLSKRAKSQVIYENMKHLKEKLLKETDLDTGAFEKKLFDENKRTILIAVFVFLLAVLWAVAGVLFSNQWVFFLISVVFCSAGIYLFIKYEARLSHGGRILKEDWLGFKLYLETAERYRMQNLTPDMFEKYLPYAMIFGIEKKWARAFDAMNLSQPQWYGGVAGSHSSFFSSGGPSGFSASAFSSSLSSSFSSAFSSSGAGGGASGGGGGAGGGGGGGGGGAS